MCVMTPDTNTPDRSLVLIGLRGSGKTTLGRAIAERDKMPFVDLDDRVLDEFPERTITEVWRAHGEKAFRDAEVKALEDVLQEGQRQVIALGGGTPMVDAARELLLQRRDRGELVIVYLRCEPEELQERLGILLGENRPSLTGRDPIEEVVDVFRQRDPAYQKLATKCVEGISSVEEGLEKLRDWRQW